MPPEDTNYETVDWNVQKRGDFKKPVILFAQTPIQLLRDPEISPAAKTLYAILHSYADVVNKDLRENPKSFVSGQRLSKDFGRSTVTVWKRLAELQKKGWIRIKRRGYKKTNQYTLVGRQPIERARIARDRAFREWKSMRAIQGNDVNKS